MHFLYPSNPLRSKQPDQLYAAEFLAIQSAGFQASVFDLEAFESGVYQAFPPMPKNVTIIYRGWMLSSASYGALTRIILDQGAKPLTDITHYLLAHHLPNWYPVISEFTPETRIFPSDIDLTEELNSLGWGEYFIKDYVKSLKTSVGSRISSNEQAAMLISEMRRFRGVIEGGFCVRRVEPFLPDTEKRYFVLDSTPFAVDGEIPAMVSECARRVGSRFFSVDVIERSDGELRIVEIGDGQVSDIVGWSPELFAKSMWDCFGSKN